MKIEYMTNFYKFSAENKKALVNKDIQAESLQGYADSLIEKEADEETEAESEEAQALNRALDKNMFEYQKLSSEIEKAEAELRESLEPKYERILEIKNEVHNQMRDLNLSTKKADKVVAKLVKQYEKSSSMSYKKLWDTALMKVNDETKKMLVEIQETSKVRHTIQEQFRMFLKESNQSYGEIVANKVVDFIKSAGNKLMTIFSRLRDSIMQRNDAIDALDKLL